MADKEPIISDSHFERINTQLVELDVDIDIGTTRRNALNLWRGIARALKNSGFSGPDVVIFCKPWVLNMLQDSGLSVHHPSTNRIFLSHSHGVEIITGSPDAGSGWALKPRLGRVADSVHQLFNSTPDGWSVYDAVVPDLCPVGSLESVRQLFPGARIHPGTTDTLQVTLRKRVAPAPEPDNNQHLQDCVEGIIKHLRADPSRGWRPNGIVCTRQLYRYLKDNGFTWERLCGVRWATMLSEFSDVVVVTADSPNLKDPWGATWTQMKVYNENGVLKYSRALSKEWKAKYIQDFIPQEDRP